MREYARATERANQAVPVTKHKFASKVPIPFQRLGLSPNIQHARRRRTTLELAEYLAQLFAQPYILAVVGRRIHFSAQPQTLMASLNELTRQLRFAARGKRERNNVDFARRGNRLRS